MKSQYNINELRQRKLLMKPEAAFYIGVSLTTLEKIIKTSADFPALTRIGIGRGRVFVNREKLDEWIDRQ